MKWSMLAVPLMLAACGTGPEMRFYVLAPPAEPVASVVSDAARPMLEMRRVTVPDYLDTTDMMRRDGRNELKVSTTGRWGERLSMAVADALDADLTRALPGWLIARRADDAKPARHLEVDVDAFDVRPDGSCVLTARWVLLGPDRKTLADRRNTFVTAVEQPGSDAAVAAAMTGAVGQLAETIAAAVRGR